MIVIAHDAAWGGWGLAICRASGPIATGHVVLGRRVRRWQALAAECHAEGGLLVDAISRARREAAEGEPIRAFVEAAARVAPRGTDGRKIAAGSRTASGLGEITGPILVASALHLDVEPWSHDAGVWRSWWGIAGGDRAAKKAKAVALVRSLGWGAHLDPWPATGRDGGKRADVAEAILMGVGAAKWPERAEMPRAKRDEAKSRNRRR